MTCEVSLKIQRLQLIKESWQSQMSRVFQKESEKAPNHRSVGEGKQRIGARQLQKQEAVLKAYIGNISLCLYIIFMGKMKDSIISKAYIAVWEVKYQKIRSLLTRNVDSNIILTKKNFAARSLPGSNIKFWFCLTKYFSMDIKVWTTTDKRNQIIFKDCQI